MVWGLQAVWRRMLLNYRLQRRNADGLAGSRSHGSAGFASDADLVRAGLVGGRGLIIGKRDGRLLRFDKDGHLITFAPTRSGKGVGHVIPNLLAHRGSVVVNDIKGENYAVTARQRATFSKVVVFSPFGQKSDCFNPIDFIRINTDDELDDVKVVADMMIRDDNLQDPFWSREARSWLEALILFVAVEHEPIARNLGAVRHLLMQAPEDFMATIEDMVRSSNASVRQMAGSMTATEAKVAASVLSTAKSQTAVWDSVRLQAITGRSDFRMEDLKSGVVSLYIVIPPENLQVYAPVMRLMVGLAVKAMTRVVAAPKERVLFLVDEFAALGYMQPIEEGITLLAGYGISLWLFVQDLSQIKGLYRNRWETLLSNCSVRCAFGISDVMTARLVSEALGNTTIFVNNVSRKASGLMKMLDPFRMWRREDHVSRSETARALMTPDEVMRLHEDNQLIFVRGARPVVAEKVRYYREKEFAGLFDKWT